MAFIRAAILYAPPEKSTELIKSNCRYGTCQPRHETVLHNNSNNKTNKLQNIATQLFVQNIILLKYYARWKYLESFCFFFYCGRGGRWRHLCNLQWSRLPVRDRISNNETKLTDRYMCWIWFMGHWIGVGGELRTWDGLLWAKWWPVFTTYYGCGLSRCNKLCVRPVFLLYALLLTIFITDFRFSHSSPQLLRLRSLCATDLNAFWFILIYFRLHSRVRCEWMWN